MKLDINIIPAQFPTLSNTDMAVIWAYDLRVTVALKRQILKFGAHFYKARF
jgi:hypothetical protein